jgi:hypothetical protein
LRKINAQGSFARRSRPDHSYYLLLHSDTITQNAAIVKP